MKIYLIDFGLAKIHLNEDGNPIINNNTINTNGFVGTLTYASINAHNKQELSRRDDLWSFFFMILELLDEKLPWRNYKNPKGENFTNIDNEEIKKIKEKCINEPEKYLFVNTTKNNTELLELLNYLKTLKYESKPNYLYIYELLNLSKNKEIKKLQPKNEIKEQILNLQKNLLFKTDIYDSKIININGEKPISHDHYKLASSCSNKKSLPSLYSTNNTSYINYKTTYINCISANNQENFYESMMKEINRKKNINNNNKDINKLQIDNNLISPNSNDNSNKKKYYINIHEYKLPIKIKMAPINQTDKNNFSNSKINSKNHKNINKIRHLESDKSIIESLVGKPNENTGINNNHCHKPKIRNKLSIHEKRKHIKFQIIKKEN